MVSASFSTLRVLPSSSEDWGLEAATFQPLKHNSNNNDGNDGRTSYFISKSSEKKRDGLLKVTRGDFGKQDYKSPDLLAALHVQSSGYIFLESLHPTQEVYYARDLPKQLAKEQKRLLPLSKPPKERMLVLLDFDARIFINDEVIEFKIGGSLDSVPQRPAKPVEMEGDVAMGNDAGDEGPQILVQQSYPQESLRLGDTDITCLTPAAPETIQEEPKVHETPSVKSRYMNPNSATVTLSRAPLREDTFDNLNEADEPTSRRNEPAAESFLASVPSNGLTFGGHNDKRPGEMAVSQLSAMNDTAMSTSDEEEVVQSSKFFKPAPAEVNSVESTADEEVPTPTIKIATVANTVVNPISITTSPEETDEEKEDRESEAGNTRKHISEVTTHVGSMGSSKKVSPAVERADDRKREEIKDLNTPLKPMKQGVPEGFLYEEHKKETTPKQTYGKNKRAARSKPKGKAVVDKVVGGAMSDDELMQDGHGGSFKVKDKKKKVKEAREVSDTNESDEREDEEEEEVVEENISSRRGRGIIRANEEEDTITETADEEEEIAPPRRTQGRRGRKTVQSQQNSTAGTEIATEVELKSGKLSRKRVPSVKKPADVSETVFSTTVEEASNDLPLRTPARSTRKRRRTPGDGDGDQGSLNGEIEPYSTPINILESTIQVAERPKSKRAKTTPPKKLAAKTLTNKGGRKKDVASSPPPENIEKALGDTQYTFTDVTQTQTIDRVEVKTPSKTPKKPPGMAKRKAALLAKKVGTTPSAKRKVDARPELTEEEEEEEEEESEDQGRNEGINDRKTRTRDRYEGDSPKIVFSNSGLDERKDIEKFLRANGGKKIHNVSAPGVNFLVVGPGELKRTPKLTVGVALGKWVVEDQWLIDSKEVGYFLDPDQYIPHDPTHEKAWLFSLRTAITRGRKGENNVLKDYNVYITSSLLTQLKASKQEESLVEMLKAAGAGSITKKAPKGRKADDENGDRTLILGTEKGDGDVNTLEKLGWNVHGTGIVAVSVLRGRLEVSGEEFRILTDKEGSQKVGRARKSK